MLAAKSPKALLAAVFVASLALVPGCATETGRSTVGGLVYGSMLGTTIAPGIGSAIGAGVGLVAGALEGTQREHEKKIQEEAYREKFYRLRDQADQTASPAEGGPSTPSSPSQSERFRNLLALQERRPLLGQIEGEAQGASVSSQTLGQEGKLHTPREGEVGEEIGRSRASELYKELAEVRRQRRALEDKVSRLAALLEEYDRGGQKSPGLIAKMEEELGESRGEGAASESSPAEREISYLQQEYEFARGLKNAPLAEMIASRYESLTGWPIFRGPISSLPTGF